MLQKLLSHVVAVEKVKKRVLKTELDGILMTVLLECQLVTFSMTPVKLCCYVIFPIKMLKYKF